MKQTRRPRKRPGNTALHRCHNATKMMSNPGDVAFTVCNMLRDAGSRSNPERGRQVAARQASSFLKKRSKKIFSIWRALDATRALGEKSFFGSFFSKKELLACLRFSGMSQPTAPRS
jgi:hypothetical protein